MHAADESLRFQIYSVHFFFVSFRVVGVVRGSALFVTNKIF